MKQTLSWMPSEFISGLVSVVIPTYNRADFLLETLNSVVKQSYRPIEIVLVDDGSTDNTRAIVEQFTDQHKDDKTLSIQCHWLKHSGASFARNYALKSSQGEFIQFLDSDDYLHPHKFLKQVANIKANRADFVWSPTIAFKGTPNWSSSPMVGEALIGNSGHKFIKQFIQKGRWCTLSGLFHREACIKTGPWQTLKIFQDWEYHIRMLEWDPKVHFVAGNLSAANHHDQGRIGDKWKNGSGLEGALEAIQLVEAHTQPDFYQDNQWHALITGRYLEVANHAELTGYPKIAQRARKIIFAREQSKQPSIA